MKKHLLFLMILFVLSCEKNNNANYTNYESSHNIQNESKIHGSVFIVTKGGESIKLGLVEVAIVDAEQIKKFYEKKLTSAKNQIDIQTRRYHDITSRYLLEYGNLLNLADDKNNLISSLKNSENNLLNSSNLHRKIAIKKDSVSDAEFNNAVLNYEKSKNEYLENNAIISEKIISQKILLKQLRAEAENQYPRRSHLTGMYNFPEAFLELETIKTTKTNADGNFMFSVEDYKNYVVIAHGSRHTGKSTENYNWMVSVNSGAKSEIEVILSNDNLIYYPPYFDNLPGLIYTEAIKLPSDEEININGDSMVFYMHFPIVKTVTNAMGPLVIVISDEMADLLGNDGTLIGSMRIPNNSKIEVIDISSEHFYGKFNKKLIRLPLTRYDK